ncbi:MAG TPA: YceI family protein [Candidatus Angelobacter sp.]|nr:YceI family protein [Candidatus Angelobacter sp.]
MVPLKFRSAVLLAALASLVPSQNASKDKVPATNQRPGSVITIHVHKSGLFSGFGHNHTVTAPVTRGTIDPQGLAVQIVVLAQEMKVVDPEVSDKDRAQIQTDMFGPKVLDAAKFPEIKFVSMRIEPMSAARYHVTGKLELHGVSRELAFEVTGGTERYRGQTKLKQTDFGIQPVSVAGGTIKVKDEIELEFDIRAADLAVGTK